MICFHKWSGWGEAKEAYSHIVQHKVCTKCGLIKWRKIGLAIHAGRASIINEGVDNCKGEGLV